METCFCTYRKYDVFLKGIELLFSKHAEWVQTKNRSVQSYRSCILLQAVELEQRLYHSVCIFEMFLYSVWLLYVFMPYNEQCPLPNYVQDEFYVV
jgi:hypothetical protein